jgi:hypothetical protein
MTPRAEHKHAGSRGAEESRRARWTARRSPRSRDLTAGHLVHCRRASNGTPAERPPAPAADRRPDARRPPGSWPAINEPEQQAMLAGVLGHRAAGRAWSNTNVYLLSGIAECWSCGSGLQRKSYGPSGKMTLAYGCLTPGCRKVARDTAMLDAYVSRMTVNRLNHPQNRVPQLPDSPLGTDLARLIRRWRSRILARAHGSACCWRGLTRSTRASPTCVSWPQGTRPRMAHASGMGGIPAAGGAAVAGGRVLPSDGAVRVETRLCLQQSHS